MQIRQWVKSWNAHLGVRATPKTLVDAITRKGLAEATALKDQIKREFQLLELSSIKLSVFLSAEWTVDWIAIMQSPYDSNHP